MNNYIFTNNAIEKIKTLGLSEDQVLDVFNKGDVEEWKEYKVSVKKYLGYEICVFWIRNEDGKYSIVSVSKRGRR